MISPILKNIKNHKTIQQGTKYIIVGGVCTLSDIAILFYLTNYVDFNYLLSSVLSFTVGIVFNYFLCVIWIFDVRIVNNRYQEFLYYLIITLGALGINTLIIWVLTHFFDVYFLFSKIFASFITLIYNFALRKFFLHTAR